MLFVSLIAVSAVSAADNVSDAVAVSDVDESEVIAVDNEVEPVSVDESDVVAADNGAEPVSANAAADSEVLKVGSFSSKGNSTFSFGNGTTFDISSLLNGTTISFGNGTTMDLSSLLNGTTITFGNGSTFGNGTFDISSLLNGTTLSFGNGTSLSFGNSSFDLSSLVGMLGGNTKKDSIEGSDLTKYYTKNTAYKVTVKNGNDTLTSGNVVFTINNKEYVGHIGSDGVASVNLKTLKPGTYYITAEYGTAIVKHTITVKKAIITKNVVKKYKKAGKFNIKILNSKGKVFAKQTVKVKFQGKVHTLKTNKKGIATLKLSKKLKVGKYAVKTTYAGMTVTNKITVKK
ncbi:hypothetical protein [Methanobrevibacter sp.]